MNKKIMALTATGLLALGVTVGGSVLAHDGEDHSPNRVMAQTAENNSQRPDSEELKTRLQERKDALNLRLSNAQKNRLQTRCKSSQGKLRSVEGRINGIETSRNQVYGNLVDRLKDLSAKLQTKNVDTADLDEQILSLEEQVATFKANLAEYKQAVSDLAAMDCESDPEAFKAALEQARTLRATLFESGQNIKAYVRETIKPTLVTIRTALAAQETDDSSEETTE